MNTPRPAVATLFRGAVIALACATAAPTAAGDRLQVVLTNDDGWDAPGITAMREALCARGHAVVLVAPAVNQSGRGSSLNVGIYRPAAYMTLTRHASDACGAVYSLAAPGAPGTYGGTPADAVMAALTVLSRDRPPDLVVSGLNLGQNLGLALTNASGTVGAALQAGFSGIPAVAASVAMDMAEETTGFPSTRASFAPAAAFVTRLVDRWFRGAPTPLGPVRVLNVNFPARYAEIRGVALTRLARRAAFESEPFDVGRGHGDRADADPAATRCDQLTDGASCRIGIGIVAHPVATDQPLTDTAALAGNLVSITPLDGDLSVAGSAALRAIRRLDELRRVPLR